MSIPCPPVIQCVDPPDAQLYALEDPPLPQITCVQGSAPDTVTLSCCGQQNTVDLSGMSPTQRRDAINNLVNQCVLSLGFCGVPAPSQLFGNAPQTVITKCPDGTEFSVVTPGCSQITTSQDLSNALARSNAKLIAPICLSGIPGCLCAGTPYSATIQSNGQKQLLTWTVAGSVPPGLNVHIGTSSTLLIDGTPTTYGSYTFMIRAASPLGNFMTKAYTLSVIQISTVPPAFTVGEPYLFQMVALGGSGFYQWEITNGSLPPGMSFSPAGLISGTPTGQAVNPITFVVVDTKCEVPPAFPPQPQIALSTVSSTQSPVVIGYSEFPSGPASTPPKKYHTVTWSGSSEQQLWYLGVQIGGARYNFSGSDNIDTFGNITSNHVKNLSVMCNGASNRATIIGGTNSAAPNYSNSASFLGYFGTNATSIQPPCLINPTELCMSSNLPYALVGNVAQITPFAVPQSDLSGLWGSVPLGGTQQLSFIGNANVTFPDNETGSCSDTGTSNVFISPYAIPLLNPGPVGPVTTGLYLESFSSLVTPCGNIPRPPDWTVAAKVIFTSTFSAVLSDEYTDAEALSNAPVVTGNSNTAINSPRTMGFTATFTSVAFTLTCTNLLPTTNYVVSVELQDLTTGVTTVKNYNFTSFSSINTINDVIPTPLPGHQVQVRHAKIAIGP